MMVAYRFLGRKEGESQSTRLAVVLAGFVFLFNTGIQAARNDRIETAGEGVCYYLIPAATVGLMLCNNDWQGGMEAAESLALTGGVTAGLKYSVNEKRPDGRSHSFPSWHAAFSFDMAEFARRRYGWWCGMPLYTAASFVGYSRVEARDHYTHDVAAGALLGFLSSCLFTTPFEGWRMQAETNGRYCMIVLSRPL